jgi:hypothetical protein
MFWTTPTIGTFSFWNMTAPLLVTSSAATCGVVTNTTPDEKETGYSSYKYSWGLKSCVSNETCPIISRVYMTEGPSCAYTQAHFWEE